MNERLLAVIGRLHSQGFTLLTLLEGLGIDQDEQNDILHRVCGELDRTGRIDIAEKLVERDLLNDDQVVTVIGFLLRELVASIGHLRPVGVRLNQYTEIVELAAPPSRPESRVLLSGYTGVGAGA